MTGLSHGLISWLIGQGGGDDLRDRRLIAWFSAGDVQPAHGRGVDAANSLEPISIQ